MNRNFAHVEGVVVSDGGNNGDHSSNYVGTRVSFDIEVQVADLENSFVGVTTGRTITLDADAAGWGWFVDPTPADDFEFAAAGDQGEQNRIDLLTVVMHELGHLLGHDHDEEGVMAATLSAGIRQTGVQDHHAVLVDQVFGNSGHKLNDPLLGHDHESGGVTRGCDRFSGSNSR